MFERLKQLGARLLGRLPPAPGPPGSAEDPHAGVREPRRYGPGGRNSAVALMEPEPEATVRAIGSAHADR